MAQLSTFLWGASLVVLLQVAFAADPTAKFTPPNSFVVGQESVAKCTIGNFVPANAIDKSYSVIFYFISTDETLNPNGTAAILAVYAVIEDLKVFIPVDLTDQFEVSSAQGDISVFPDFEIKINPNGYKAKGQYLCSVLTKKNANDLLQTEYKSNVWNGSFLAINEPTLSIQIADNDSKVGTPFTVKCKVQIEYGDLEDDFMVKYYFAPTNDSWKYQIAQWNVDPNSNNTTFTTTQIISPLNISRGDAIFPDYQVVIMPNSVQASGAYECSFIVSNHEPREYSSNRETVLILESDKGNNSGFATKLQNINILWLCISMAFVISFQDAQ